MKLSILVICLFSCFNLLAQQLQFSEIGSAPAYCRLFDYQSGNGVVYAAASGGSPDYTYEWTNLATGADVSNSVWGGLNPGEYQIKIWDSTGDSIVQIVTLDSINPKASFDVVSDGLSPQGNDLYWGEASVYVDYVNTSTGVANLNNPNADTTFFWRMTQFSNWYIKEEYSTESFAYNYAGAWGIDLCAINNNGCSDTVSSYIWLNGTAGIGDELSLNKTWFNEGYIHLQLADENDYTLEIFDLKGRLIKKENFNVSSIEIEFNSSKGMYLLSLRTANAIILNQKFLVK
jgi:hypothetical protein